jgi:hypothetical protein
LRCHELDACRVSPAVRQIEDNATALIVLDEDGDDCAVP